MGKFIILYLILYSFLGAVSQNISGVSKIQSFNIQKVIVPPILSLKEGSIKFTDDDHNSRLDAYESSELSFEVQNIGKGPAVGLVVVINVSTEVEGIELEKTREVDNIQPGESQKVIIPIKSTKQLTTGKVNLEIIIKEPNGLDCDPFLVDFYTLKFQEPKIELIDGVFSSELNQDIFKKKIPAKLNLVVQNIGQSKADKITVKINLPSEVLALDGDLFSVGSLSPGESFNISFGFIVTANYAQKSVNFNIVAKEGYGQYGSSRDFTLNIDQKLVSSAFAVKGEKFKETQIKREYLTSDVDRDIPLNNFSISNRYALIIGNEDYSSKQTHLSNEIDVEFARNDAETFNKYLVSFLGFKKDHVFLLKDATSGEINRELEKIVQLGKLDLNSELVFFYAGHGLPEDETKTPYIIPVDVSNINLKENGIALNTLYQKLASSDAKRITIFLDACFSGGGRDLGLMATRGMRIKPSEVNSYGNMVIFSSSTGEERSLSFEEKQHGYFTYYLLKKLKETEGKLNYLELSKYLNKEVTKKTLIDKNIKQTPTNSISPSIIGKWESWSFR